MMPCAVVCNKTLLRCQGKNLMSNRPRLRQRFIRKKLGAWLRFDSARRTEGPWAESKGTFRYSEVPICRDYVPPPGRGGRVSLREEGNRGCRVSNSIGWAFAPFRTPSQGPPLSWKGCRYRCDAGRAAGGRGDLRRLKRRESSGTTGSICRKRPGGRERRPALTAGKLWKQDCGAREPVGPGH